MVGHRTKFESKRPPGALALSCRAAPCREFACGMRWNTAPNTVAKMKSRGALKSTPSWEVKNGCQNSAWCLIQEKKRPIERRPFVTRLGMEGHPADHCDNSYHAPRKEWWTAICRFCACIGVAGAANIAPSVEEIEETEVGISNRKSSMSRILFSDNEAVLYQDTISSQCMLLN